MQYWYFIFLYLLAGSLAGMLSGLLGVGGGILIVPFLAFIFKHENIPEQYIMHLAAGTSLAVMVITSWRSLLAHRRYKIVFWPVYQQLMPGIIIGTAVGAVLAFHLHSKVLSIIFGLLVLLIAIKMFLDKKITTNVTHHLPGLFGMNSVGFIIGAKSGLLGLGGGTLSIPFLTYCNVDMRVAVMVSLAVSITVATVGSISVMITGMHATGLPVWTTGYIYWPAWLGVVIGNVIFSPLGVKLSHRTSIHVLKRFFAAFLIVVGIQMLW